VALTVDDGPDPDHTPAMLDELDRLGLVATFFCLGEHVEAHPALVAEVVRRGHGVGTHGHRHAHHLLRSPLLPGRDLDRAVAGLRRVVGAEPRWYRPPYGQASGATLGAARRRGLRTVLWSAWGREWVERDATAVAARVRSALAPGAVVLLHDSDAFSPAGTAARARDALDAVAADLDRLGLATATLDEVLA
jgi:peptidoglycan/xylan/chitin deacetylase (PgdA/CDA1 family)